MEFKDLPVYRSKEEILKALKENQAIIIESPTGSGKTTQMPLILLEAGYGNESMIGITQPRRIAALSVCGFIKKQLGLEEANNFCSCKMRFYDTTDSGTRIKIMTDGTLLQELKHDPMLRNYSVIMVDEAHERSLNIDFILGLLKNLMVIRPDLKVIVSSATINTKSFSRFLGGARIISIKSKVYPVSVKYLPPESPGNMDEMIDSIVKIINMKLRIFVKNDCRQHEGQHEDMLVFLTGEFDIKTCVREILYRCDAKRLQIYPLYGRLNKEEQELVFTPTEQGKIKVVIATNIAETSITIDGIRNVIDCGLAKVNFYNQHDYTSALTTEKTSRSSCEQRKGRAGRVAPGFCYRLYSEEDYKGRREFALEEILRTDLSEVIMRMSDLGIYDYEHFPFITRPRRDAILSAEKTLRFIGAIDRDRHLTKTGQLMVNFPLAPRHSRVIVEAMMNYPDVMEEILIAVSFISIRPPFLLPAGQEDEARNAHRQFNSEDGDFVSCLELFNAFTQLDTLQKKTDFCRRSFLDLQTMLEIENVDEQLGEIVSRLGFVLSKGGSKQDYLCCLASGLKQYVCVKTSTNCYKSLTADRIYIHPGSAWFKEMPKFILAGEIVNTSRMYARTVSPLSRAVLDRVSPDLHDALMAKAGVSEDRQKGRRKERIEAKTDIKRQTAKQVQVYGRMYDAVQTISRKGESEIIVQIPYQELGFLAKSQSKARRHPKNFKAVLMVNGKWVQKGDSLFNIIDLHGKLPDNLLPVDLRKEKSFRLSEFSENSGKLDLLGRLAVLPKDKDSLGFVELLTSGKDGFFLNANKDFYDSLSNTSYSLMLLKETIKGNQQLNKAYNRIINKLNQL